MMNINDAYGRDLDLNLLRVFAVVAEEGSLTRAASRLYVTQPAVSAAMGRLARFIGADLFTRQSGGVVLTARGIELLAAARAHLQPLVAATLAGPSFDPARSTATVRVGLADCLEAVILPTLLQRMRAEAPRMQLVVLRTQFRTVEEMLLSSRIDLALSVADDLPRSILRESLSVVGGEASLLTCLYDPRYSPVSEPLTEEGYFACEHIVVSYAGDARGIVEDALGRGRVVRVSVPAFGHVPALVDGSPLVATVPVMFARHVLETRPHLRATPLPFALDSVTLDLLWLRAADGDAPSRFVRGLAADVGRSLDRPAHADSGSKRGARRQGPRNKSRQAGR